MSESRLSTAQQAIYGQLLCFTIDDGPLWIRIAFDRPIPVRCGRFTGCPVGGQDRWPGSLANKMLINVLIDSSRLSSFIKSFIILHAHQSTSCSISISGEHFSLAFGRLLYLAKWWSIYWSAYTPKRYLATRPQIISNGPESIRMLSFGRKVFRVSYANFELRSISWCFHQPLGRLPPSGWQISPCWMLLIGEQASSTSDLSEKIRILNFKLF